MQALGKLLYREHIASLKAEAFQRELAEAVFTEWRDLYIANLCAYIRTYREIRERGLSVPEPYRSPAWCSAAVHLLTIADLDIQDYFLRADPDLKDKLVAAVLADGGITRLDGFFAELPVV